MRNYKFRAWHPDENQMYYFENFTDIVNWQSGDYYKKDNYKHNSVKYMQFTGTQDINGEEIYEGDIVRLRTSQGTLFIGKVYYNDYHGRFSVFKDNEELKNNYALDSGINSFEVIGNIFENPQLLEISYE